MRRVTVGAPLSPNHLCTIGIPGYGSCLLYQAGQPWLRLMAEVNRWLRD